ncbi:PAS domain-containing sensor histidine kinase [Maribacter litoralis]|uniref:PAS domain-containing sensor histidine kinase n=1 Tax=Maribacter litoralis TaxID=2059726 RepID=UPI003D292594
MTPISNRIELQERHHQIFIEQAPTAIAMLDKNMVYLAVSKRWLKDYKLDEQDVIGRSHYDVFPEIGDDWKKNHQDCLKGAINICDEAPFKRADGSIQWIYWDVRPWYNLDSEIGGLLMHTGDITEQKEKELEKKRFETILSDCSEVARIGTWEINTHTNEIIWSDMVYEIHDVSNDFKPSLDSLLEFIEEEVKRDFLEKCMLDLLEKGKEMNEEFEIRTPKGNLKFIKAIGKIEYVEGLVTRVFGIVQDITQIKESERELNKAYNELDAIFSSSSIAIISTDKDGVINRFNSGAEHLLGYSAKEMIGIKKPEIYLFEEELNVFKKDMELEFKGDSNDADFNYRNEKIFNTRQWTFKRKDGSTFPGLKSLTAIQDKDGLNDGFIAVITDISKIKEVKDELRKKNDLLNFAEKLSLLGHWQWNTVLDKVQWSENLYTIFELEKSVIELKFDTYFSFVHPNDKELVAAYFKKSANDKTFYNFTHKIITASGVVKTIHLVGKVIANDNGEMIEMFGTCQDITESIKAQEELRKKNDLLNFAEQISMMSNWKWDTVADKVQWSENFYTILELDEAITDLNFNSYYRFVHPEDIGIVDNHFEQVNKNKRWDSLTHRIITTSGKVKTILILGKVFTNEKDEIIEMIGTCQDITESKKAENKLIEAKQELEISTQKLSLQNQQLADFTHITSHNLRAPVANLNSLLEIHSYAKNEEERTDIFNKFSSVIDHLSSTLNTLIEALKAKVGDANEQKEQIEFNEVLENTVQMLSGAILKSKAVINSDFSKLSSISYNKIYMESIFLNLIGNAIKYSAEDRIPHIQIKTKVRNGKNIITFKDNGLGIDLDKHGHKLFGLNKVFHRHPDAKGVGLYLTKTQIESMGGTITATSEVNVGTIFTINFN